jgi:hypothetical protein
LREPVVFHVVLALREFPKKITIFPHEGMEGGRSIKPTPMANWATKSGDCFLAYASWQKAQSRGSMARHLRSER